jgi:hypothetical protein
MTMRRPCPRCGHVVAVKRDGSPVRHKEAVVPFSSETRWCSGEPKRVPELVLDLLACIGKEREVLRGIIDEYIGFGDKLATANEQHALYQGRSAEIIHTITDRIHADIEAKNAEIVVAQGELDAATP